MTPQRALCRAEAIESPADLRRLMGVDFSAQQVTAITAPMRPGVIVAGAGSGKTTVMAARVVWLVGSGVVRADQVLGLTFTNKAAAELSHRIRDALVTAGLVRQPGTPISGDEDEVADPTVLTYHAYAARLLAEHGLRIGHEPDTRLIADASRFQLAARAIRAHREPINHLNTWLPGIVRGLLALDAQLCEHLVSADDVRRFQAGEVPRWAAAKSTGDVRTVLATFQCRAELLDLVEDYRKLKADLGVMDFSDQMARGAVLAQTCPEVSDAERDQFKVVLLDEYQDTSVAQARLLKGLFSGAGDSAGRGHPVTAVGDPCQAIYGWRGASVSNIEQFGADFPPASPTPAPVNGSTPATHSDVLASTGTTGAAPAGEVTRFALSVNRRSQARILQVANHLAADLYATHHGAEPLSPKPGARDGVVRSAVVATYQDELDFLAAEVPRAHHAMRRPQWSEIGVLVRDNATAADVHDALTMAGAPVEVVGLDGLLRMPEIAQVVATLELIHDVTANASLLTLLTGVRWAIGTRDLALLGRRARWLASQPNTNAAGGPDATAGDRPRDIADQLGQAVSGVDPADIVSLLEALDDPGGYPYSAQARARFRLLSQELWTLRRYVGEPLLDLVRRVIDVTGIDVELAASTSVVAAARRDNLSMFLDAVSTFAGIDGDASLPGFLAYLAAEDEYARGLSLAVPTESNSVKLLTVHRAKGLEWDVVFLPGMCDKVFPSSQGRPRWPTTSSELPGPLRGDYADLPKIPEASNKGLAAYKKDAQAGELLEERRLVYVAVTRARHQLVVSSHWWGPQQKRRRGPSTFMETIVNTMATWGQAPEVNVEEPDPNASNPTNRHEHPFRWPVEASTEEVTRRQEAAALVRAATERAAADAVAEAAADLMLDEQALVAQWDGELQRLVAEARAGRAEEIVVPLPATLSATSVLRLSEDPERLARELARPMPRKPSPSARFGTRFHAWVETHLGQQQLIEPDDLPGRADSGINGDAELRELIEAFKAGPYADRAPYVVEAPFALVLAGRVIRGRIDAVYQTATGYQVVDWKTNQQQTADPLQLAIYKLAWAELQGIDAEQVDAAFYYVRTADVVSFDDLPSRLDIERLVSGRS
ncbi:MAG: UvrD-helicase domain-containing protein [Nocardioidaceae bacterium]